ncbi:MAG: type II toxin-antitoxin system prevent-host-death family antitoxin [Gemmatimonadota bacterium]|nr:type II toxin-antitoxin system prevent-host-death family antitoxin [Gemmatimonadota bacterium]
MEPKTIGATLFKERCLALLDRLSPEGLVITKHGKPVARVLPHQQDYASLIGSLRDRIRVRGDIMTTGVRWDADDQP